MKNSPVVQLSEHSSAITGVVHNPIVEKSWADVEPTYGQSMLGDSDSTCQQKNEADYEDKKDETHTLSFYETVAFTVNYVMGTGFLTIPWAFFQAGTVLSLGTITVMVVPAFLAIIYVLEAMSRGCVVYSDASLYAASQKYQPVEEQQKLKHWSSFIGPQNNKSDATRGSSTGLMVGDKKIEITELCGLFIGRSGKICYTIVLSICKFDVYVVFSVNGGACELTVHWAYHHI
jgi:hypothetical protein